MTHEVHVGIVGATGYTGAELLRLLSGHPNARLRVITSRAKAGHAVADVFPSLRGLLDLSFEDPEQASLEGCDVVFFATPNGTAMTLAPPLLDKGIKVIDLAADFRLKDAAVWEKWYGMPHACPDVLAKAVYGLPEVNRDAIKNAQLVANPGCYPTVVQLGFLPLIEQGMVDVDRLIADAKSGVSGAGRTPAVNILFAEAAENFKAYAVSGHRHHPEIVQGLNQVSSSPVTLTFTPHLTPMVRGIHATLYATLNTPDVDVQSLYERRYDSEPFVDVMGFAAHPETRSVRGANICRMAVHIPLGGQTVVVLSVIDNLVKGAAGQAVHNLNLMFGLSETSGLEAPALVP
ncbi:MAG: N-acetyl-gamma-glutamyl-phosphate reductase [Gammaproteobacteria bacterium]|nr:MAG: N-acetyl-gamma-glutamyl-phosphate reductase [Gammaproteobacteria bacterium]